MGKKRLQHNLQNWGENRKLTTMKLIFWKGNRKYFTALHRRCKARWMDASWLCSYELLSLSLTACGSLPSLALPWKVAGLCLYELWFACFPAVLATRARSCLRATHATQRYDASRTERSRSGINTVDRFWDLKRVPKAGALPKSHWSRKCKTNTNRKSVPGNNTAMTGNQNQQQERWCTDIAYAWRGLC